MSKFLYKLQKRMINHDIHISIYNIFSPEIKTIDSKCCVPPQKSDFVSVSPLSNDGNNNLNIYCSIEYKDKKYYNFHIAILPICDKQGIYIFNNQKYIIMPRISLIPNTLFVESGVVKMISLNTQKWTSLSIALKLDKNMWIFRVGKKNYSVGGFLRLININIIEILNFLKVMGYNNNEINLVKLSDIDNGESDIEKEYIFTHCTSLKSITYNVAIMLGELAKNTLEKNYGHESLDLSHRYLEYPTVSISKLLATRIRALKNHLIKYNNLDNFRRGYDIYTKIKKSVSTGIWKVIKVPDGAKVSKRVENDSHLSMLKMSLEIIMPISQSSRDYELRKYHISHRGYICPLTTPQDQACGLRLYLCSKTKTSFFIINFNDLLNKLSGCLRQSVKGTIPVFIDGDFVFFVHDIEKEEEIALNKIKNTFSHLSWYRYMNAFYIRTFPGRFLRKELNVYIEPCESNRYQLSQTFLCPICEITPFIRYTDSSRIAIQSSSLTSKCISYNSENQLLYPQKQLCVTNTCLSIDLPRNPIGTNIVLLIGTYKGFNMEDAIIVSKHSIELGLFNCYKEQTFNVELPSPNTHVESHIKIGDEIFYDTILFTLSYAESNKIIKYTYAYASKVYKLLFSDEKITLIIRRLHQLQVGDKVSSLFGQKSVCSILVDKENLPFEESTGITPDLIINPHSIISRATLGQLYELHNTREMCTKGLIMLVKNFGIYPLNEKFSTMINGHTGEIFKCEMIIGVCYYLMINQLAVEKIKFRSIGSRSPLTGQPLAGRRKKGGLRIGYMERNILLSSGMYDFLYERLNTLSDLELCTLCKNCFMLNQIIEGECIYCNTPNYVTIKLPITIVSLQQILLGLDILLKISF
jgi:DNA-directed RNA polymerase beta subunit